jgi:hypothetical protein
MVCNFIFSLSACKIHGPSVDVNPAYRMLRLLPEIRINGGCMRFKIDIQYLGQVAPTLVNLPSVKNDVIQLSAPISARLICYN